MPQSAYYGGHGREVMEKMVEKHGSKKGKRVFYATANKHKNLKPKGFQEMGRK